MTKTASRARETCVTPSFEHENLSRFLLDGTLTEPEARARWYGRSAMRLQKGLAAGFALGALGFALGALGCVDRSGASKNGPASATGKDASAAEGGGPVLGRAAALLRLEHARDAVAITDDDVSADDPEVRRAAARALARIAVPAASAQLLRALSDEDGEVVGWAAYGLGVLCRAEGVTSAGIVRALVVRAAALDSLEAHAEQGPGADSSADPPAPASPIDPVFALARALGRCGTDEAEHTLALWLDAPGPRARHAALGLGDTASSRKTLLESTQSALLAAASGSARAAPLAEALYPFNRLEHPSPAVAEGLLEVARARLADRAGGKIFAVRAIGRSETRVAGLPAAADDLAHVLTLESPSTLAERIEAARSLGRLGIAGQRRLADALGKVVRNGADPSPTTPASSPTRDAGVSASARLTSDDVNVLQVVLEQTHTPVRAEARHLLFDLASLPVLDGASTATQRRAAHLRCAAALLLVSGRVDDPLLTGCDPDPKGEIGERAAVVALGRRPVQGSRLALWRKLLGSVHARVHEEALELCADHPEIEGSAGELKAALGAREAGVVATAAQVLVKRPALGAGVEEALRKAFERAWAPDDVETVSALIEAAGALRLEPLEPRLQAFCTHTNPTLREHAARALAALRAVHIHVPESRISRLK